MSKRVLLLVGTNKGAFIFESDESRKSWEMRGPFCEGWPINHIIYDRSQGALLAGGGNAWYGSAVWRSTDMGETWSHSSDGLHYPEGGEPLANVWALNAAHGAVYAGVQPAGLFKSGDGGVSWEHVRGLSEHPSRPEWEPGGAGLILHSIVAHPLDPKRMWVAISSAGTFYTADGGATWEPRNRGVRAGGPVEYPEVGVCVHHLEMAAGDPDRLYQQNHMGMYASHDGGRQWDDVGKAMPSTFGFACAAHPHDVDTFYLVPLNGDSIGRYMPSAAAAVWKTEDAGKTWRDIRAGLPQSGAYFGVLRQAMATDDLPQAGVYFGTSGGHVFASSDEGESYREIASYLPRVSSIEVAVLG